MHFLHSTHNSVQMGSTQKGKILNLWTQVRTSLPLTFSVFASHNLFIFLPVARCLALKLLSLFFLSHCFSMLFLTTLSSSLCCPSLLLVDFSSDVIYSRSRLSVTLVMLFFHATFSQFSSVQMFPRLFQKHTLALFFFLYSFFLQNYLVIKISSSLSWHFSILFSKVFVCRLIGERHTHVALLMSTHYCRLLT